MYNNALCINKNLTIYEEGYPMTNEEFLLFRKVGWAMPTLIVAGTARPTDYSEYGKIPETIKLNRAICHKRFSATISELTIKDVIIQGVS